jgi:hypothetical protein
VTSIEARVQARRWNPDCTLIRMVKTWIIATGVLAVGAVTLIFRWRRRKIHANALLPDGQAVSSEWLSNARSHQEENW